MKCVSVGSTGDATIVWKNTNSSTGFRSYHIFHSTASAGPYILIDSVNVYATQMYSDVNANANSFNAFYYVELQNTNGTTISGDTIQAMRLHVIDPGDGYASLQWNTTHTPVIATNSPYYLVYREYPVGVFTLIDSVDIRTSSPHYLDEITICGDTVKYRIEVNDGTGCTSVSSVDGDYFIDRIGPIVPEMDSVSVDASGNAVIGWDQNSSSDTYAYVVFLINGNTVTVVDTVFGISNTFYQSSINATSGSQVFRLLAIDNCGNPCGAGLQQQTIFLSGVVNPCTRSIQLNWNSYVNSPATPFYKIVMNENVGADVIVGLSNSTSFTVNNLVADTSYCFRIVALLNGVTVTSTSNSFCVTPNLPVVPQFSYIRSVSVFPNDVVTVTAYVDPLADVKEYHLERANSPTGNFTTLQALPFTASSTIVFNDNISTNRVYYYRVSSVDSCGNDALPSQVCRNLKVDTSLIDDFTNELSWNSYQTWFSGTSEYHIYRSINGVPESSPFKVIYSGDSTFIDDVRDQFFSQGEFCYFIVAVEAPGNQYGFLDSSLSNEICLTPKSAVYIPNAFHPGGLNNTFNPAEAFIGLEGYSLEVYDRFGEQIFMTKNPSEGWDGTLDSHHCDEGVYIYFLKARNEKGIAIEKIGMVTLVR